LKGPLVDIQDLKTYFYTDEGVVKAVDGVSITIERGDIFGIVGESGCGKSTLALSILRLVPRPGKIVGGKIIFDGENLLEKSENEMRKIRGRKISIVFQDPTEFFNPVFTVGGQIAEAMKLHQSIKRSNIETRIIELLRSLGFPSPEIMMKRYPHEYSGGMKQRAMIAMALSCQPELLIADEPTTSLDVTVQAQILDLLRSVKEKFATTILLITHNLGVVAEMCNKVAVMYAGKIVECSDVFTVFKKPLHPYTQALLDSIPRVDIEQRELKSIPGRVPDLTNIPNCCRFHGRCKYEMDVCRKEDPPLINVRDGHTVSCFLYC